MTNIIIIERDGTFNGAGARSELSLAKLKALKETNGRTVYEVTAAELQKIKAGAPVSLIDDVVQVGATPPPPPDLRAEARERALAAIKANKETEPWGRILYDKAIADGSIEA